MGSCVTSSSSQCAFTVFCGYHSDDVGHLIYANMPYDAWQSSCNVGQQPNGGEGDSTINVLSHELAEAITDPHGDAWYDSNGDENGDKCAWYWGTTGNSVNLLPGSVGAHYTQTVNGHHYFAQLEWSQLNVPPGSNTATDGCVAEMNTVRAASATTQVAQLSFSGSANPQGTASTAHFEYGLTAGYGSSTSTTSIGSGGQPVAVSAVVPGLSPGTTYHYRLAVVSGSGGSAVTAYSADQTATTTAAGAGTATHLSISGGPFVGGSGAAVTVTALDGANAVATGFTGTVTLTSSDGSATLPSAYTFVGGDAGVHAFTVTLRTLGTTTITATDATTGVVGSTSVSVAAGPATHLTVTMSPGTVQTGVSSTATVTALDANGNVATSYRGTVHVTSSDTSATLPANYTFVSGDNGVHQLTVTPTTVGTQTVTVTDIATPSITGSGAVTVTAPPAPSGGGGGGGGGGGPPNIAITIGPTSAVGGVGTGFTLRVGVANNSTSGANTTALNITLNGLSFVSGQTDRGPGCTPTATGATCDLDFFPGGLTSQVLIGVTVTSATPSATATFVTSPGDSDLTDNTATWVVQQAQATPVIQTGSVTTTSPPQRVVATSTVVAPTLAVSTTKLVTTVGGTETLNVSLKTTKSAKLTFTLVNAKGKTIRAGRCRRRTPDQRWLSGSLLPRRTPAK
ncbi:MAG: hypothetical protein F2663_01300 [Actinobacteria bacterium]|nr:hypothetical protein [Actinomycetota bacterium]